MLKKYIEVLQLKSKKTNNSTTKWAKDLNRHFSRCTNTDKHVKRCSPLLIISIQFSSVQSLSRDRLFTNHLEKCKSKPH